MRRSVGRLNSSSRQSSVVSRRIFGLKMEVQPERLGARDPCSTFGCFLIQSPIRLPASNIIVMVYQSKAQIQAELVGVAEVIFVTSLDDDDDEEGEDVDFEGEDGWMLDDMDPEDDALQYVALRVLEFAQSMSGSGSRGPYDRIACSKDYFPILLQQPDQRFRYVFR
jgi:hypothetical protein